ncbi:hypothetical protein KCU86_g12308, partial [Aureobasidium melanogenum]
MSTSQPQPKSILKKTSSHTSSSLDTTPSLPPNTNLKIRPKSDAERKRLETAIQHAHLIQEQKAILAKNLDYIEELSDYPASSSASASETSAFLEYMISFQPSDYDALIEERHVNGRCGYTLCANAPRKAAVKAPWQKGKGVENWCSDDCAKKALYVKAQLSETPAWERRAGDRNPLVLYGGAAAAKTPTSTPAGSQMQLPVRPKATPASNSRDLAYERGEIDKVADAKMDKVLKAEVQENSVISSVMPPTQTRFADSDVHDLIEGYQPRGVQQGNRITIKSEDVDSDEEDD